MRKLTWIVSFTLVAAFAATAYASDGPADRRAPINAAIGDASWIAAHGERPSAAAGEVERIRTHLRYVVDRLDAANIDHLDSSQKQRRARALDGLRDYAAAGVFPQRDDGDGYGERRPRFIDDRGVHCAVGEMIRRSGRAELAAQIDTEFEYSYVPQIRSDALADWAAEHGFTSRELAMIQPQYGMPPSKDQVRSEIVSLKDRLTLTCAARQEVADSVIIKVHRPSGGRPNVSVGLFPSDFAKCFRRKLAERGLGGGGAWSTPPTAFRLRMKLDITPPEKLAEQRFAEWVSGESHSRCVPRPGEVPENADVSLRSGAEGLTATVETAPNNPEVDRCLEESLRKEFREFADGGHWDFELSGKRPIGSPIKPRQLAHPFFAATRHCVDTVEPEARTITARVDALPDEQRFSVEVTGAGEELGACLERAYNEHAPSDFAVPRKLEDGSFERYFRITHAVSETFEVAIGLPPESRCPDGGVQISIGGTRNTRCHGRTIMPKPGRRHY